MIFVTDKLKNTGFYFFVFIISVGYFVTAFTLGAPVDNGSIEPSFFPLFVGFCAVVFSSILFFKKIQDNVSADKSKDLELKEEEKHWLKSVPTLVVTTAVYIGLFTIIGYFLSSLLYVFAVIIIFSDTKKLATKFIISLVIVILGYLIFEQLFGVRLPALEV